MNEELQTINGEHRMRSHEPNRVNGSLEPIPGSFKGGAVVVADGLHIRIWNHTSGNLWELRSDEVQGKHPLALDVGLPMDKLKRPIRACLTGDSKAAEVVTDAIDRRGRSMKCRVSCARLLGPGGATADAVVVAKN